MKILKLIAALSITALLAACDKQAVECQRPSDARLAYAIQLSIGEPAQVLGITPGQGCNATIMYTTRGGAPTTIPLVSTSNGKWFVMRTDFLGVDHSREVP
jgi:hypothetical protein